MQFFSFIFQTKEQMYTLAIIYFFPCSPDFQLTDRLFFSVFIFQEPVASRYCLLVYIRRQWLVEDSHFLRDQSAQFSYMSKSIERRQWVILLGHELMSPSSPIMLRKHQGVINNHLFSHKKIVLCRLSYHTSNETIELAQWNMV